MKSIKSMLVFCWLLSILVSVIPSASRAAQPASYEMVMQIGRGSASHVDWNPQNDLIAVGGSQGVWIYTSEFEDVAHFSTSAGVGDMEWSPDGQKVAAGNLDGMLQIWDVEQKQLEASIPAFSWRLDEIAWSPDSTMIATVGSSGSGSMKIWDTADNSLLAEITENVPQALEWSPDSAKLAGSGYDGLAFWNMQTWTLLANIPTYSDIRSLYWRDHEFVIANGDAIIRLDDENFQPISLSTPPLLGRATVFSSDGNFIATTAAPDSLYLGDLESDEWVEIPVAHDGLLVQSADWSPESRFLVTSTRLDLRIWDAQTHKLLRVNDLHSYLYNGSWSPDGQTIAAMEHDGNIMRLLTMWDAANGTLEYSALVLFDTPFPLEWSPDGSQLAISYDYSRQVDIWNTDGSTEPIFSLPEENYIHDYSWSSDNRLLVVYSENISTASATISIRDASNGELLHSIPNPIFILKAAWSPNNQYFAAVEADTENNKSAVKVWSGATYELLNEFSLSGFTREFTWTPDESALVGSTCGVQGCQLWKIDLQSGSLNLILPLGHQAQDIAWSYDGHYIAYGDQNQVFVWDSEFQVSTVIAGFIGEIDAISWSPDSHQFLTSSGGVIQIWEIQP